MARARGAADSVGAYQADDAGQRSRAERHEAERDGARAARIQVAQGKRQQHHEHAHKEHPHAAGKEEGGAHRHGGEQDRDSGAKLAPERAARGAAELERAGG